MTQAALEALVLLAISSKGEGAAKGRNCTIKSIETIDGGSRVTFAWTSDSGTPQTSTLDVSDGRSIASVEKSISDHLLIIYSDGTQEDAGLLPSGEKGDQGDSAYDVAVSNGFVGTEAEWLDSLKGDDGSFSPELEEQLNQNTADIATLKGTGEGSVSKAVADGIADVVANAPSDFDTLKEIADYIASDKTNATQMNNAISENAAAISRLEQSVNDLEAAVQNAEYDDSAITSRVSVVEGLLDGHTVGVDVPSDAIFTDTVYDDTAIAGRIQAAENNIALAQSSIVIIQTALGGHTLGANVPANAVFTDTVYDDTELRQMVADKANADDVANELDNYIAKDDLEPVDIATIKGWFTT